MSSNRVAVSMVIFLHSQTETPAIGHTRTALLYADLKPFIFPSRYIGYWQSLLSPLCPWTGAKADARKDLWTEWCDLCLSSSCYTVSLSVYFSVDSNEELVGQCSNLDFWVCGQSCPFSARHLFSHRCLSCAFPQVSVADSGRPVDTKDSTQAVRRQSFSMKILILVVVVISLDVQN